MIRSALRAVFSESTLLGAALGHSAPHAHISFSQEGEDRVQQRLVDEIGQAGHFVDVGAHHPFRFSNTYALYRQGWRGLNIDPLPGTSAAFKQHRPDDLSLEVGVGPEPGQLSYYRYSEPALNTFSPARAEELSRVHGYETESVVEVAIEPLSAILAKHWPEAWSLDLLSVDAEGFDLSVLESLDWSRWRPRIVWIEEQSAIDWSGKWPASFQFMIGKRYRLRSRLHLSALFEIDEETSP